MIEFIRVLPDFLDHLARATPVILLLGGLLAFYYREKVKQILSKSVLSDIEKLRKDLNQELADHAARHQRELEAYKVTLIAEAEHIKAAQEVKKSLALRIAERRFVAIAALLDAYSGLDVDIGAHITNQIGGHPDIAEQVFLKNGTEILDRLQRLTSAVYAASPMLDLETKGIVAIARQNLSMLLAMRTTHGEPTISRDSTEIREMFAASFAFENALRGILVDMERLD